MEEMEKRATARETARATARANEGTGATPPHPRTDGTRDDGGNGTGATPPHPRTDGTRDDGGNGTGATPPHPRTDGARDDGRNGTGATPPNPRTDGARANEGTGAEPPHPRTDGARDDGGNGTGATPPNPRTDGTRDDGRNGTGATTPHPRTDGARNGTGETTPTPRTDDGAGARSRTDGADEKARYRKFLTVAPGVELVRFAGDKMVKYAARRRGRDGQPNTLFEIDVDKGRRGARVWRNERQLFYIGGVTVNYNMVECMAVDALRRWFKNQRKRTSKRRKAGAGTDWPLTAEEELAETIMRQKED